MNLIHKILKDNEEIIKTFDQTTKVSGSIIDSLKDEIDLLEKLQLSPILDISDNNLIASCFSKIVNYFYQILNNKLNPKSFLNNDTKLSFFNYLKLNFHNLESVKFIQNFYDEIDLNKKSLIWLIIVLLDMNFYAFLMDFYKLDIEKFFLFLNIFLDNFTKKTV